MTRKTLTTLFSRMLFVLGGLSAVVFVFYLIQTTLSPVPVPPLPPAPTSARFDPALDVTKNAAFGRLRPVGPSAVLIGAIGRSNPFTPPPTSTSESNVESRTSQVTTSTLPVATSTVSATTTY